MHYPVTHRTTYRYGSDVSVSHHLRHSIRATARQQVEDFQLGSNRATRGGEEHIDYYGNPTSFFSVGSPHEQLAVTARSRVRVAAPLLPIPPQTPPWETVRERCAGDALTPDSADGEFRFDSTAHPASRRLSPTTPRRPFLATARCSRRVFDFTARIYREFKFDPARHDHATPIDEVFGSAAASARISRISPSPCLRSLGLPARYVSGYLETLPPPGKARLIGADASHAWFSVWCPGHGWIDADPTNNLLAGDRHITVAWGRDFSDVSPMRGVVVGGGIIR